MFRDFGTGIWPVRALWIERAAAMPLTDPLGLALLVLRPGAHLRNCSTGSLKELSLWTAVPLNSSIGSCSGNALHRSVGSFSARVAAGR